MPVTIHRQRQISARAQSGTGCWAFLRLGNGKNTVTCDLHWINGSHLVTKKQTRKQFRKSILEAWCWKCAYCHCEISKAPTLDHIIPASKGGLTVQSNLVACCQSCNVSKSDQPVWQWFRAQPFYAVEREALIWIWHYDKSRFESRNDHALEKYSVI